MARVVFYANDDRRNLDLFEYYRQDLDALEALGHEVFVCTRYRDIPPRFDLMFVWWWTYALYPVALSRLLRRPAVITGTFNLRFPAGFPGQDYFARPVWQRILIRTATRLATLNLFVNRHELLGCADVFRIDTGRYMPHVLGPDYLRGPADHRVLALFNLSWSGRQNLTRKGIPELIKAVALVKKELPSLRLALAGHAGDGADYLRQLVDECDVHDSVEWLGPLSREEKLRRLREYEIYVQPSHYEGFGLAIAEAMGSGACIVTCDVGAVRDVVGDCGIYVTPGSPEALAEAIRRVMTDHGLRRNCQARALERARNEFSFRSKLTLLGTVLDELGIVSVGQHPSRRTRELL